VIVDDGAADTLYGGNGNDKLYGQGGLDKLYGEAGNDGAYGGNGNDTLAGGSGADILRGDLGSDWVYGGSHADVVMGDTGNDRIYGGLGRDKLYGGKGKDMFVFDTKVAKSEVDTVKDFVVRDDTIWLDNAVMKALGKGAPAKPVKLKADAFHIGKHAEDREDRVIYDKGTGKLYYDSDGSGAHAQVQIAKLAKNLKMTHADFFVI
jgi:Ca2+-binding RTX toxin-like protein